MERHGKGGGAKKEKISALRTKLDDFIEEDKKRRDRNVYILERFEKMRSTVALLKSINNNIITESETNVNNLITRNNDRIFMRQHMLNYREKSVDDSNILKEISKKYILIPRIYSINKYPVIDIKQSEDVDWRNKYNILDELKKKEREEPPERDMAEHFLQKDSRLHNNNNFRSNDNNIDSLPKDTERYNISQPNKNISSNYEFRDEPTSSLLNSNDWKADSKMDEYSNVEIDYKSICDSNHIENNLNINKDSKCIKEELVDMNTKVPETNYSDKQDNSIKILKEHKIPINNYHANAQVIKEVQHETESHPNKENNFDKHCEDINNGTPQLPPNILPKLKINETDLGKYETEQHESFYSESVDQNVENGEVHQDETETYANDNNFANDQYNNYYEEPQLQQEKHEPYNNVSQESQEITGSRNQNYEQKHGDSHQNQFNNDNHSENYENYEAHNNHPADNQNYEYQNVDQQNNYYEEPQLQQEKHEPYNNVSQESQEITGSRNQNYEQKYGDSHQNQFNNDNHSENYENYEAHNNHPTDNQNYEYPNVDQQNYEYNSSNNQISSEPTQETNRNLNENKQNYAMHENRIDFNQQQQIYDHQNYIDVSHGEIQQPYIDNNEVIPENNTSENVRTTNQEETYDMQHEYNEQNLGETEQQFTVGHYSSVQNENGNLQHDYNNQNINEIYQDNQGDQEVAYDFAAQGQEIQHHDGLGYSEQNQGEFVHYDEGNGLNSQNEIDNLQEEYGDQNIHGIYNESLQAQDIHDNVQYDYTPQSNELRHNDVNDPGISQKNYVEI